LILLGLLGAFALNEWQDARTRAARVDTLLAAIRAELETNLARHAAAADFNSAIADLLWNEGSKGVEFLPQSAFPDGLFKGPSLTSAAWTTAQSDAALSNVPVEQLLMLARIYEAQRRYVDDFDALLGNLYATALDPANAAVRMDGIAQPLRLGGVLRDYAGRGQQLVAAYRTTLLELDAAPAKLDIDAAAPDEADSAAADAAPAAEPAAAP
jgi:hypothetical protein